MLRREFLRQAGGALAIAATASMGVSGKGLLATNPRVSTGVNDSMSDKAFNIRFDSDLRNDLRQRLAQTRWSDAVTTDWLYGMNESFLKCMWPKDLVTAPKARAERFYNVQQYSHQKHGGHFPGWEAPALSVISASYCH